MQQGSCKTKNIIPPILRQSHLWVVSLFLQRGSHENRRSEGIDLGPGFPVHHLAIVDHNLAAEWMTGALRSSTKGSSLMGTPDQQTLRFRFWGSPWYSRDSSRIPPINGMGLLILGQLMFVCAWWCGGWASLCCPWRPLRQTSASLSMPQDPQSWFAPVWALSSMARTLSHPWVSGLESAFAFAAQKKVAMASVFMSMMTFEPSLLARLKHTVSICSPLTRNYMINMLTEPKQPVPFIQGS